MAGSAPEGQADFRLKDREVGHQSGSPAGGGGLHHGDRRAPPADRGRPGTRVPHLHADRLLARGDRDHQGAGVRAPRLPRGPGHRRGRRGRQARGQRGRPLRARRGAGREEPGRAAQAGDRPDRRAEPGLAAAVPALDRARAAAHGRARGRAGQAHRARRPVRQAGDGRGQPAPRRLHRQGLPRARAVVPGPDPGGLARASSGRSRSSTTGAATSSPRTRPGGSARP